MATSPTLLPSPMVHRLGRGESSAAVRASGSEKLTSPGAPMVGSWFVFHPDTDAPLREEGVRLPPPWTSAKERIWINFATCEIVYQPLHPDTCGPLHESINCSSRGTKFASEFYQARCHWWNVVTLEFPVFVVSKSIAGDGQDWAKKKNERTEQPVLRLSFDSCAMKDVDCDALWRHSSLKTYNTSSNESTAFYRDVVDAGCHRREGVWQHRSRFRHSSHRLRKVQIMIRPTCSQTETSTLSALWEAAFVKLEVHSTFTLGMRVGGCLSRCPWWKREKLNVQFFSRALSADRGVRKECPLRIPSALKYPKSGVDPPASRVWVCVRLLYMISRTIFSALELNALKP